MKKFINDPAQVVSQMVEGLLELYPGLARLEGLNVLLRPGVSGEVALISGGGSGHEPAHAGYIGTGMLRAAVLGEVFTSPSADSVLAAIRAVACVEGVLLIVKNYTGDRLNFGFAAERARAEGIRVETVLVADDVALAETHERLRRRGIAGTVLVHKIAGAAAAAGRDLSEVARVARAVADDVASMGISLSAGTVPAVGKPSYELREDELELGLGIHGEPGVKRMPMRRADELADELIDSIFRASPYGPQYVQGTRLAVMVNNLGATTAMELAIFARRALEQLRERGFAVERVYSGTFMSSLEAAGLSLSLLPVDDSRLQLLDAPTSAPAWPNAVARAARRQVIQRRAKAENRVPGEVPDTQMTRCIRAACEAIHAAKDRLTELDSAAGDGDLGITLARGADALEAELAYGPTLKEIGPVLARVMGGTSGPLYGVLFIRAGHVLESGGDWAAAFLAGCQAVMDLGGAKEGDRTMLDALMPAARALKGGEDVGAAAELGAAKTAGMIASMGRSSYLGDRVRGMPDPGAVAVAIWLRAVWETLKKYA